jgi:hypothetical protein
MSVSINQVLLNGGCVKSRIDTQRSELRHIMKYQPEFLTHRTIIERTRGGETAQEFYQDDYIL